MNEIINTLYQNLIQAEKAFKKELQFLPNWQQKCDCGGIDGHGILYRTYSLVTFNKPQNKFNVFKIDNICLTCGGFRND